MDSNAASGDVVPAGMDLMKVKDPLEFVKQLGTASVEHTSGPNFFAHLQGVMEVLRGWGADHDMQLAGLFHSIYGTEGFQGFRLSLADRPLVRSLIGARAERVCYLNCVMDRASLDTALRATTPTTTAATTAAADNTAPAATGTTTTAAATTTTPVLLGVRQECGGGHEEVTWEEMELLITLHLADWLEAVERSAVYANERHGWAKPGDAWGYRRGAYRMMARRLGGAALEAYEQVFAREPPGTRHINQEHTPDYDWSKGGRVEARTTAELLTT